jgi:hypothetical protein
VSLSTVNTDGTLQIVTEMVPMNPLPTIVNLAALPPVVGFIDTTVGRNENWSAAEIGLLPAPLVTTMSQVCDIGGEGTCGALAVIEVSFTTVKDPDVPQKSTLVVLMNELPVIVMVVPTVPLLGVIELMLGDADCTASAISAQLFPPFCTNKTLVPA